MKRDYKLYIEDIKDCILTIQEYMQNISLEQFLSNKMLRDAVIRRFEIIGEASKNIPLSIRKANPHINWEKLSLYRDILSHQYFTSSMEKVWKFAREVTPKLKEQFSNIKEKFA